MSCINLISLLVGVVHHRGGQRRRLDEGEEAERRGGLRPHLLRRNHHGEKQQRCCHLHLTPHCPPPSAPSLCHSLHLRFLLLHITLQRKKKKTASKHLHGRSSLSFVPVSMPPLYPSVSLHVCPPPLVCVGLRCERVSTETNGRSYLMVFVSCLRHFSVCVLPMSPLLSWAPRRGVTASCRSKCFRLFNVIY